MISGSLYSDLNFVSAFFFQKLAVVKLPNYTANVHIIYNACAVSIFFFSRAVAAADLFYRLLVAVYCQILQLPTPNKHSLTHKGRKWGKEVFQPFKTRKNDD